MRRIPFAIIALICVTNRTARAGGGAATGAYEDIDDDAIVDLHGLADVYVQRNFNAPTSKQNQLRAFDGKTDTPSLGILRLTAARAPRAFGFRVDLAAGELPDAYLRFDPAAGTNPDLARFFSYFEQAFLTASIPISAGHTLRIDAGKFETPVGLEDNEAIDSWIYSRSFLYLLGEPSFHTGVRATYRVVETLAVSAYVVNGWDTNVLAGNGMRSIAGAVTWNPTPRLEAVVDYMGGSERAMTHLANPTLSFRHELDGYVRYALDDRASFACTADYGRDAGGAGAEWWGVAGYMRYRFVDWLAAAVRGEHYEDPEGFTSGTKQRLAELTATLEGRDRVGPLSLISRLEYRRDQSDARVFVTSSPRPSLHQDTLSLSLVTTF